MKMARVARMMLQLRIALSRSGLFNNIACALLLMGALAWWMGLPQLLSQLGKQQRAIATAQQALRALDRPITAAPRPAAQERLEHFYDTLGEPRYAEQQVKTLFSLAAKTGLTLTQAEYRLTTERNGRYATYQVILPVKGPYSAIRQFCEQVLLTIPFASLDELHFKRDTIANRTIEARLKLTLYLSDGASTAKRKALDNAIDL